ncbi:MAG TPA: deoxyribose-phosphate aldolase [Saprospiraceae bacterium]|nr:deoxyribose-phosphate aldolase [Saprospiraceae bacterium]
MNNHSLAHYIDHTVLQPRTTLQDIQRLCADAMEYGFFGVCIPPYYIDPAKRMLSSSKVKVISVAGFPFGFGKTNTKVDELMKVADAGADEIDVVVNVNAIKNADYEYIRNEINSLVTASGIKSVVLKIILETCYLTVNEIEILSNICMEEEVHFLKTSTGFGTRGASIEDIMIMKNVVGDKVKIKASGGIKTRDQVLQFIEAGASRIGTSSSIKILQES